MSKWFVINSIVFVFAWLKIFYTFHGIHMVIGGLALSFVLYNWTRHAVFSSIRSSRVPRAKKISLANLSKRVLPYHKWTGTTALVIAIFHMIFVWRLYGLHGFHWKLISGYASIIVLFLLVIAGWLRWYRTTVITRYIHWTLAFVLIFFIMIHILIG